MSSISIPKVAITRNIIPISAGLGSNPIIPSDIPLIKNE